MNKSKAYQLNNLKQEENKKETLKKLKKQVKRNNINSISCYYNSAINISRSSN